MIMQSYVPVFSGHGTPDVEDILASSPEAWYEDAKRAVDFVRGEGFHTVAAFGLSMGGIMATKLATEHLVEYAGTFVRQYLLGILSCQDCFKVL